MTVADMNTLWLNQLTHLRFTVVQYSIAVIAICAVLMFIGYRIDKAWSKREMNKK